MSIYILHPMFYYLSKKFQILNTGMSFDYITIFLYTALIVFLLSRDYVYNGLNKIFDIISRTVFKN